MLSSDCNRLRRVTVLSCFFASVRFAFSAHLIPVLCRLPPSCPDFLPLSLPFAETQDTTMKYYFSIDHKVDFLPHVASFRPVADNADIHGIPAAYQFVIDQILHDVTWDILPIIQPRVARTDSSTADPSLSVPSTTEYLQNLRPSDTLSLKSEQRFLACVHAHIS